MASNTTMANGHAPSGAKNTLSQLRKAAGYHSAKDFALVLGIPASTYARYERKSNGPDSGIPLRAAWAIADKLNTTIDAIVGRFDEPEEQERDLNAFYRSLSDNGKVRFDEYVQFLDFRERIIAAEGR